MFHGSIQVIRQVLLSRGSLLITMKMPLEIVPLAVMTFWPEAQSIVAENRAGSPHPSCPHVGAVVAVTRLIPS